MAVPDQLHAPHRILLVKSGRGLQSRLQHSRMELMLVICNTLQGSQASPGDSPSRKKRLSTMIKSVSVAVFQRNNW